MGTLSHLSKNVEIATVFDLLALFILGEKIRREKHFSHQFPRADFTLGKEKTLRIATNHAVLLKFIKRNKRWGKVK